MESFMKQDNNIPEIDFVITWVDIHYRLAETENGVQYAAGSVAETG